MTRPPLSVPAVCATLALSLAVSSVAAARQNASVQSPATSPPPARVTFEVASIRRNTSGEQGASVRPQPGGRLVITNNSVFNMIRNAYNAQRFEMVPGPDVPSWIDSDRWDIVADGPDSATQAEMMAMLQHLLEDRFKLVARREMREMPVYTLVRARSDGQLGPQLHRSATDCAALFQGRPDAPPPPRPEGGGPFCGTRANQGPDYTLVQMHGMPLSNFVRNLGGATGRFVVDRTELQGMFDLELKWAPDQVTGALSDSTSLFTALQEQLGLRLEPGRAPVQVLAIYSAERPIEN